MASVDVHPLYNSATSDYDIAILHLQTSAQLTDEVQPICLPDSGDEPSPGTNCFATGWGRTSSKKISSHKTLAECVSMEAFIFH